MGIDIYWASGSPYSWRVLLAAEIKGVPYTSHLLQFSALDHKSPEVLALNPRGKVPILKDGDFAVYESLAILEYLEGKFPDPPLFGRNPATRAKVWQSILEIENYLNPQGNAVAGVLYRKQSDLSGVQRELQTVHRELGAIETRLEDEVWLVGDTISAADLTLLPLIQTFRRASTKTAEGSAAFGFEPMATKYPNIASWVAQIEALPVYAKTVPPHWKESS